MRLALLIAWVSLLVGGVALGQDTATPTDTPTETPTLTETPTHTETPTKTPTPTNTPTPTVTPTHTLASAHTKTPTPTTAAAPTGTPTGRMGESFNTHVHAQELTLLQGLSDVPLYEAECLAANGKPDVIDKCRCVIYFSRRSNLNKLYYSCEDGVEHLITNTDQMEIR